MYARNDDKQTLHIPNSFEVKAAARKVELEIPSSPATIASPATSPPKSAPPAVGGSNDSAKSIGLFPPLRTTPVSALAQQSMTSASFVNEGGHQVPRDRYGFKKSNSFITEQEFDEWNAQYSLLLARRKEKWDAVMRQFGLSTEKPTKFPGKSDTMKRSVRKGIPPEYRGAAWFWYADGPKWLEKHEGVYEQCLKECEGEALGDADREAIERDLHRTFPDNIRFKPERERSESLASDPTASLHNSVSQDDEPPEETSIIKALRRVLQAFAIRNPHIGYCQSLNFLAGMLLLFLDEDEEKSFALLNIATTLHLPGNHNRQLGADVDIAVLMSLVREQLPGVWEKIDDWGWKEVPDRLPTISLTTTSWFMSCFIGSLPTETVLRVWDSFFYEGAKTLFRTALAIFKIGLPQIRNVGESLEVLQVLQAIPRRQIDPEPLLQFCFARRGGGFGTLSQDKIEGRRAQKKKLLNAARSAVSAFQGGMAANALGAKESNDGSAYSASMASDDPIERPKSAPSIRLTTKHKLKLLAARKKSKTQLTDD
jgi:hypothetical protein